MKKTQFTENQIIAMLKKQEQGIRVADISIENNISLKFFQEK